jgi:site-specific recombinase XerD
LRVFRGKGAKDRTLYLDEHSLDLLHLWKARRPQSGYLLCTLKGEALSDRYLRAMVGRYARRANLPKRVHPHMLRHTFATELLQEGYNIREVQKLLGHSDLSTTMIYLHIFDAELRDKLRKREPLAV